MSELERLRGRLAEINRQSEAITAGAAAMERSLNDDERAKLDTLSQEFQTVEADIARLEALERQKASVSGGATAAPEPAAAPAAASATASATAAAGVDGANVKRAESILIALGVILAVFGVLALIGQDFISFIVDGIVSLLTFLVGYKAIKDGNIGTARTFCIVMGSIYAALLLILLIISLAVTGGALGPIFWIIWLIGWLIAWGYFYAYQCITPKQQRKMGL